MVGAQSRGLHGTIEEGGKQGRVPCDHIAAAPQEQWAAASNRCCPSWCGHRGAPEGHPSATGSQSGRATYKKRPPQQQQQWALARSRSPPAGERIDKRSLCRDVSGPGLASVRRLNLPPLSRPSNPSTPPIRRPPSPFVRPASFPLETGNKLKPRVVGVACALAKYISDPRFSKFYHRAEKGTDKQTSLPGKAPIYQDRIFSHTRTQTRIKTSTFPADQPNPIWPRERYMRTLVRTYANPPRRHPALASLVPRCSPPLGRRHADPAAGVVAAIDKAQWSGKAHPPGLRCSPGIIA
ncbi:hypothetical protein MTO96_014564 [Rhipicephalus appendiculatus]